MIVGVGCAVANKVAGNIADGSGLSDRVRRIVDCAAVGRPDRIGSGRVVNKITGNAADGGGAAAGRTIVDGAALRSVCQVAVNAVVDKVAGHVADFPLGVKKGGGAVKNSRTVISAQPEKVTIDVRAAQIVVYLPAALGAVFYFILIIGNAAGSVVIDFHQRKVASFGRVDTGDVVNAVITQSRRIIGSGKRGGAGEQSG